MDIAMTLVIFCYSLSTVGYLSYLFLQKDMLQRFGFFLLTAGFLCHSVAIGYGFAKLGQIPARDLQQNLSLISWAVAGFFLIFQYRFNLKVLGVYAAPLATGIMIASALTPAAPLTPIKGIFNNVWVIGHVFVIFMGEAAFALAGGLGLLYLLQERSIKAKRHGFFFHRLPALERLDSTGYACIVVGFTLLTIGLVLGFVYAKSVWGRFWSWDPKEVWSGITWLLYAALIHGRLALGWRGRRAAVMAIVGLGVLLFTFFGVNFFLHGHHGGFTRL
jgi:cytochrome c-type biogenesis protein CcsB